MTYTDKIKVIASSPNVDSIRQNKIKWRKDERFFMLIQKSLFISVIFAEAGIGMLPEGVCWKAIVCYKDGLAIALMNRRRWSSTSSLSQMMFPTFLISLRNWTGNTATLPVPIKLHSPKQQRDPGLCGIHFAPLCGRAGPGSSNNRRLRPARALLDWKTAA